jgi:hypothetical protein
MIEESLPVPPSETAIPSPAALAIPEAAIVTLETRKLILKRMMADALALLGRRT